MSKFTYMDFSGGANGNEFVINAKKFTKENAINIFIAENEYAILKNEMRAPVLSDIEERHVKYYIKLPERCGGEIGEPGYTYCGEDMKGGFPVFVIAYGKLT